MELESVQQQLVTATAAITALKSELSRKQMSDDSTVRALNVSSSVYHCPAIVHTTSLTSCAGCLRGYVSIHMVLQVDGDGWQMKASTLGSGVSEFNPEM
jgi:hypothetical protein